MGNAPTPGRRVERVAVEFRSSGHVLLDIPSDLPEGPAPALLAVHGYAQPLDAIHEFARSVAPSAIVIVPEGPSTFYRRPRRRDDGSRDIGHGWIADADREPMDRRNDAVLGAALDAAAARHPLDPTRTFVLGFSQGVGVATHFLLGAPDRARGLVGVAGGLASAYRPRLYALADRPVLWVTGRHDLAYPPAYETALIAAWREAGVSLDTVDLDAPHDLLAPARTRVAEWLRERMQKVPKGA